MKIYLDIDGVLLNHKYEQMPHLREFVKAVFDVAGDEVYWLTTHCKDSNTDRTIQYLKDKLEPDVLELLKGVKGTTWDTLKTEGIDLNSEFIWFDDNVFDKEYRVLEDIGKEHCLIKVKENLDEMVEYLRDEN
jgi:hypothetical protein